MRKFFISSIACITMLGATSLSTVAQNNSGKILYTETIKIEFEMPQIEGIDPEQLKAMIPESQSSEMQLVFNSTAASYTNVPKDEKNEYQHNQGGAMIMMDFGSQEVNIYSDLVNKKVVEEADIMGKAFLIKDDMKKSEWKMAGESKEILGYPCNKATKKNQDDEDVTAWFTMQIPVSSGPRSAGQLPGMILEMQIGQGMEIKATKVELGQVQEADLKMPTKGKEVTYEKYEKIMDAKMKEMAEEYGGEGNVIIKTETR